MKKLVYIIQVVVLFSCADQQRGLVYPTNQTISNSNIVHSTKESSIKNFTITNGLKPITLQINVIVLKRDDGTGNYDLKNPNGKDFNNYVNRKESSITLKN